MQSENSSNGSCLNNEKVRGKVLPSSMSTVTPAIYINNARSLSPARWYEFYTKTCCLLLTICVSLISRDCKNTFLR